MPEKRTTFPFFASEASYGLSNYLYRILLSAQKKGESGSFFGKILKMNHSPHEQSEQ
ncbi:MAG: hypothetical protein U5L45_16985 [Saprospiraceae bacterium]|nr:hypothetical protein [Saprospiraceae bacterium]